MEITFYHTATNLTGQPYRAKLMSFQFPAGTSEEVGVAMAAKQFQKEMKIVHWQDVAQSYEIT